MKRPTRARWPFAIVFLALGVVLGSYLNARLVGQPAPPPPKQLGSRDSGSYAPIVERILPAVVSIESRGQIPNQPFFGNPAFMQQDVPIGFGTGTIVDPKGVILTNFHVVRGGQQVQVQLPDGRKFFSKTILGDEKTDLAIVKLQPEDLPEEGLPFLEFADSDQMQVGDQVLAVGAPFGLTGSVTHGIISAKSRNLQLNEYEDFLQTDAAINPGNSGGPLVSMEGKIIGINSAIKSRSGGFNGVGLAISSNLAREVMASLKEDGVVKRGYLGVLIRDLDSEVARRLGVTDGTGVVVTTVESNSPAESAGVLAGDVITAMGGQSVRNGRELARRVASTPVNEPAELTIVRAGEVIKVEVTMEEQSASRTNRVPQQPEPSAPVADRQLELADFGMTLTNLTRGMAARLGLRGVTDGVLVIGATFGGYANQAGLTEGMVIRGVDGTSVKTTAELREALEKASPEKGALLTVVLPQGGTDFKLMKLPKR